MRIGEGCQETDDHSLNLLISHQVFSAYIVDHCIRRIIGLNLVNHLIVKHLAVHFQHHFSDAVISGLIFLREKLPLHGFAQSKPGLQSRSLPLCPSGHIPGNLMDIQSQLLYQPQIVPYQPFLVNTVVLNGAVNDSAEVNFFPCGLSKITVPKISGRGQDPMGGKISLCIML